MAKGLASHFVALLYHWDVEVLAVSTMVPISLPLMGQELQTILATHYPRAACAGLC